MPQCQTCGEFVTRNYVRVFALPEMTSVSTCPRCEDDLRDVTEEHEVYP